MRREIDNCELMAEREGERERSIERTAARKGNRDRSVFEIHKKVMIQLQVGAKTWHERGTIWECLQSDDRTANSYQVEKDKGGIIL